MAGNFVDVAKILVKAGSGGDGCVSFHREKFVAAGGPDGGDGGRGGDIIFETDPHLTTLLDFKYKRKYAAANGEAGRAAKCSGKNAQDTIIKVPCGTVIKDFESGLVMADMGMGSRVVIAKGGRGGWGNSHFATPTRQIPRFAKPGLPGQERWLTLELKLIADVGLIGFPNVGKSTIISEISAAKPKIANYHFTTLTPVLGVVYMGPENSFVAADIPGLIEGAGTGAGLGYDFLRHVERCRVLLHVVDVSGSEARDPIDDFETINAELLKYNETLASRPQIVLANKCDMATEEQISTFKQYILEKGYEFHAVSAATMMGIEDIKNAAWKALQEAPEIPEFVADFVEQPEAIQPGGFEITMPEAHVFNIEAPWLERILDGCNLDDYESLQYFQRRLEDSGIAARLIELGVEENDTVLIGEYQFDYVF